MLGRLCGLSLAVSALALAAEPATHGPTPALRKEGAAASHAATEDLKHGRYMLELAEELHHTLASRHRRLRRRLAARRARRAEQHDSEEPVAGSVGQHGDALSLVEGHEHEAKPSRGEATSSLLQLRDHVSRSALDTDEEEEEANAFPMSGDEILATWRRQLTPRIASADDAYASLRAWTGAAGPLREARAAEAPLALLELGREGADAGGLSRIASLSRELADRWQCAFIQSFWTVASAEVFDKTLIVAFLCAFLYGAQPALQGAAAALAVHLAFAACFGLLASRIVPLSTLHFITAGLFGLITIFHVNEWFDASDPRASHAEDGPDDMAKAASPVAKGRAPGEPATAAAGIARCFLPVFLAEWGDRTQVVLIALDATLPAPPVVLGGALALALLTALAVLPAAVFGRIKVGEQALGIVSSVGLLLCTAAAVWSGVKARRAF